MWEPGSKRWLVERRRLGPLIRNLAVPAGGHRSGRGRAGGMSDQISTTEVRQEGFYWVVLGQNPPEIAYWERGEWWLSGDLKPWQSEAARAVSERLVFRPRLAPVA
jgi:hypothetical protein